MIPTRKMAITMASLFAMSGASAALAGNASNEARQSHGTSGNAAQQRQSSADDSDRWNWQAGPALAQNGTSYRGDRWRGDQRRWRSSSDWDALGEFDTRSDDRSGRYGAGPRMWRNLDEGSGYTYRERYYDPYADRRSYSNYMRDRYRDDQRAMRDRMRDSRDWDRGGYADYRNDRQRYYDDRRFMQSRGERDRYGDRQDRAMGPQGWRGDLDEGLITQPMSSLYEDRGAVGPQGWQPGMSDRGYDDGRYGPRGQ